MIPTTRLRNFLDRPRYALAPIAAAIAVPAKIPWTIHVFWEEEDEDDDEEHTDITLLRRVREWDREKEREREIVLLKKRWKRPVWSGLIRLYDQIQFLTKVSLPKKKTKVSLLNNLIMESNWINNFWVNNKLLREKSGNISDIMKRKNICIIILFLFVLVIIKKKIISF